MVCRTGGGAMRKPSIIGVISQFVDLRKRGREFIGLCPFHSEKHPSFSVNPQKGVFYCYGCGAGGDAITFIEVIEKTDFKGALKVLGLDTRGYKPQPRKQPRIKRAAALVAGWMNEQHIKVGALLRELSSQIALAHEIPDPELKETFEREWEILSVFHANLQRPEFASELWEARDSIEAITADAEPEPLAEFPPLTEAYRQYLRSILE